MAFTCPSCNRPLYNRRRADCEFCGQALPNHLRLVGDQAEALHEQKEQEAKATRTSVLNDPNWPGNRRPRSAGDGGFFAGDSGD